MKTSLFAAASAVALLAGVAAAQEESPWKVSGTVAVTSNYMFRGISQSDGDPALQAGVTVAHESGFYVGFWGSNIDFNDGFFSGKEAAELELDLFAGYGFALGEDTALDLNFTYYAYPGSYGGYDYDNYEISATLSHDFKFAKVAAKLAYSPDFFGAEEEAFWLNGNITVPVTDWLSISGNYGEQFGEVFDDYAAYDIGVTAVYQNVSFDARYVGTDIDGIDKEFVFTVGFAF